MKQSYYKTIEHTADMGIEVFGGSRKELFENAGRAFSDIICNPDTIQPKKERTITVKKQSDEELLQAFLSELLYYFETEHEIYVTIKIRDLTREKLTATVSGETIDPDRHKIKTGIKAVTFYQLKVEKKGNLWQARVIFDI